MTESLEVLTKVKGVEALLTLVGEVLEESSPAGGIKEALTQVGEEALAQQDGVKEASIKVVEAEKALT